MSKLYVAVPNTGNLKTELVIKLFQLNELIPCQFDFHQSRPIDISRNEITQKFLKSDCDEILFIDSDIVPPENFLKLFKKDKDIIAATCFTYQFDIPFALILEKTEKGYQQKKEFKGITECDATGFGCIKIKRGVIEDIVQKNNMLCKTKYTEDGRMERGQDYVFCEWAKELGYKIYVDTDVIASHYKTIDIKKINNLLTNG